MNAGMALVSTNWSDVQFPVPQPNHVQPEPPRLRLVVQRQMRPIRFPLLHQRRPLQGRRWQSHLNILRGILQDSFVSAFPLQRFFRDSFSYFRYFIYHGEMYIQSGGTNTVSQFQLLTSLKNLLKFSLTKLSKCNGKSLQSA